MPRKVTRPAPLTAVLEAWMVVCAGTRTDTPRAVRGAPPTPSNARRTVRLTRLAR